MKTKSKIKRPTPEMVELLRRTGSHNKDEAMAAMRALAGALEEPLRQGVLSGDITGDIFAEEVLEPGAVAEYPLDFYQPGDEDNFTAYTLPNEGTIPQKHISGDVVTVQTYDVGNSIDWLLKYSREARWNVVARALEVMEAGFVKKLNRDGWHVIIAAGLGRGFIGYDNAATAGQFTKRLISVLKTLMRRNAGGNTSSTNRGRLTDLYISPEALEDIREWDNTEVDEVTRREILQQGNEDVVLQQIYGVTLHTLDELGVNQEFQTYYEANGGTMATSDEEIVVGLDLSKNDAFVRPIKEELSIFEDPALHRRRRSGLYSWMEIGHACLDPRRVTIGSF